MSSVRPGYRKGDQHSGGGGSTGGGGKNRRPASGWEKGDVARTVDTMHTDLEIPSRPRRKAELARSKKTRTRGRYPTAPAESPRPEAPPRPRQRVAFRVQIRAPDVPVDASMRAHVRHSLRTRLDRVADHVQYATVRFRDINGPRGGIDTVCQIRALLHGKEQAIGEERAESPRMAFDAAMKTLVQVIRQSVGRARSTPRTAAAPGFE